MLKLLEEIRVILIDDDALFCRNMRDLFDAQPGVRIKLVKVPSDN
jgi:alpha-N-acetylglucosamine transferase